jgi:hypothetical protein
MSPQRRPRRCSGSCNITEAGMQKQIPGRGCLAPGGRQLPADARQQASGLWCLIPGGAHPYRTVEKGLSKYMRRAMSRLPALRQAHGLLLPE